MTLTEAKPKAQASCRVSHEEDTGSQLHDKEKESYGKCIEVGCNCRPCQDTKSSRIAMKAAQDATQAQQAQQTAGAQAALQVRYQLAQRAEQAARAALAALAGKQSLVDQLEHEVKEAQIIVLEEAASCQRTQRNLEISCAATAQASCLLKTLIASLQISQINLANSQATSEGVGQELAEKAALLEAAKCRALALMRELCIARQDLYTIKQAAYRAQCAARNACCNAKRCRRQSYLNIKRNSRLIGLLKNAKRNENEIRYLLKCIAPH